MAKPLYHVNPSSGKSGPCHATSPDHPCPFAGDSGTENHYETKEAAQSAAETMMAEKFGGNVGTGIKAASNPVAKQPGGAAQHMGTIINKVNSDDFAAAIRSYVRYRQLDHPSLATEEQVRVMEGDRASIDAMGRRMTHDQRVSMKNRALEDVHADRFARAFERNVRISPELDAEMDRLWNDGNYTYGRTATKRELEHYRREKTRTNKSGASRATKAWQNAINDDRIKHLERSLVTNGRNGQHLIKDAIDNTHTAIHDRLLTPTDADVAEAEANSLRHDTTFADQTPKVIAERKYAGRAYREGFGLRSGDESMLKQSWEQNEKSYRGQQKNLKKQIALTESGDLAPARVLRTGATRKQAMDYLNQRLKEVDEAIDTRGRSDVNVFGSWWKDQVRSRH